MLEVSDFIKIDTYEDCPVGEELLVWTGDAFEVEYMEYDSDTGCCYPANGVEFVAYFKYELPKCYDMWNGGLE